MRFFLIIIALAATTDAQTLRYSVPLSSPAGAVTGEANDGVVYDGKGGCAFVVRYKNQQSAPGGGPPFLAKQQETTGKHGLSARATNLASASSAKGTNSDGCRAV